MSHYRRAWIPGGTYFFTLTLANRSASLLIDRIDDLRAAMSEARSSRPFRIDAMVVLPEHLHLLCTLPPGDVDYATRIAHFKACFSRRIKVTTQRARSARRERGIWQRRYWEHSIRDERDLAKHADYIHFNPVKHGHVTRVRDWPWSSFHRHVERGSLSADWTGVSDFRQDGKFGE